MGIEPNIASAIIREHRWRPLRGDVLLLGRQTMIFTPEMAVSGLRKLGLPVPRGEIEIDKQTLAASGKRYIRDEAFFRLLGVPRIRAVDHSDYEGADIIHDLNRPVPAELDGIADFILDGSTLDNLFNPAQGLINIARMLKPGGRFLSINMASNHHAPYTIPTGLWALDYLTQNGFADAKIYTLIYDDRSATFAAVDLAAIDRCSPPLEPLNFPHLMATVVFAEKAANSTWDQIPAQQMYRPPCQWNDYERHLARIRNHPRPDIVRSRGVGSITAPRGYRLIEADEQPLVN